MPFVLRESLRLTQLEYGADGDHGSLDEGVLWTGYDPGVTGEYLPGELR